MMMMMIKKEVKKLPPSPPPPPLPTKKSPNEQLNYYGGWKCTSFVLFRVLLEVQHNTGELILLSFEDSRTCLYPFYAVHIQMGYNLLLGKAIEVETVGYPVPARLLYL